MSAQTETAPTPFAQIAGVSRDLAGCTTLESLTETLVNGLNPMFAGSVHWCAGPDDRPDGAPDLLWKDCATQHDTWFSWPVPGADGSTAHIALNSPLLSDDEKALMQAFADQASALWMNLGNFHMLEELVAEEMTAAVQREEKIQLILDSMGDALVVCDNQGALTEVRSAKATAWFGEANDGQSVWSYLFPQNPHQSDVFEMGWMQLIEGWMPFEVCLNQLPHRMEASNDRTLALSYSPVGQEGDDMTGLVVTASDITALVAAERAEQEGRELVAVVQHLAKDASAFRSALDELRGMVDELEHASLPLAKRILHTLKGNCASLGLIGMAEVCHHQEDRITDDPNCLPTVNEPVSQEWARAEALITPLIPDSGAFNISENALQDVLDLLAMKRWNNVVDVVATWRYPSIGSLFSQLTEGLNAEVARFEKSLDIRIETNALHIPYAESKPFFRSLSHVVRNAWFHGIETQSQRTEAGKPAMGVLTFSAEIVNDTLQIDITDDGAGINWDAVAEKAKSIGMPHSTHEERLAAVMAPGLTTQDEVTEVAGRGVGLDATQTALQAINGTLELSSTRGKGTQWRFRIPLSHE